MEPCRIVLADDNDSFRRGLKRVLEAMPGVKVVGEAGDGRELLDILDKLSAHLAIVDISMPYVRGIYAARVIEKKYQDVRVLLVSVHEDKEYSRQAMTAGAEGFLLKERLDTELPTAIRTIMRGEMYFPQENIP